MHQFIESLTAAGFLLFVLHAFARFRRVALVFFAALLVLGFTRENFVSLLQMLYEFAPLQLMLGRAPLIASIVWGFSIYCAVVWAEGLMGKSPLRSPYRVSIGFYLLVGLFMMALACFYEPFLGLRGMARWQDGTRSTFGVPWIALLGYPSLAIGFLWIWSRLAIARTFRSRAGWWLAILALAIGHGVGLQALKNQLSW